MPCCVSQGCAGLTTSCLECSLRAGTTEAGHKWEVGLRGGARRTDWGMGPNGDQVGKGAF